MLHGLVLISKNADEVVFFYKKNLHSAKVSLFGHILSFVILIFRIRITLDIVMLAPRIVSAMQIIQISTL